MKYIYSIVYMDVVNEIKLIKEYLENVEKKCEKINGLAIYDAIIGHLLLQLNEYMIIILLHNNLHSSKSLDFSFWHL